MASSTVSPSQDARQVAALLALPEIIQFISELDDLGWTGRPGNGSRILVGSGAGQGGLRPAAWTRPSRLIA